MAPKGARVCHAFDVERGRGLGRRKEKEKSVRGSLTLDHQLRAH